MTTKDPVNLTKAPAEAFSFAADECKFAEPSERSKNGLQRMPVSVLARTGKPVYHWYWDWIVHDFSGMRHKPTLAFDYRHDPDEPIGFANKFEIKDDGLWLEGELISRRIEDEAARIMDLGPAGIPYEQSIHFDPRSVVLEYLPEGAKTIVNGVEVTGPITIMRQWELLRCAFCLTGVDGGTQTNFDAAEKSVAMFSLNWKESSMSHDASKPAEQGSSDKGKEAPAGQQATGNVSSETADRSQLEAEFKAGLAKFTAKFGMEDGAKYFTDGLSYEAALEKHIEKLESGSQAAAKAKSDAEAKLAQLDLGESTGVDTGTGRTQKAGTWESLFKSGAA